MRLDGAHVAVVNWRDLDHSLAGGSERYAWEWARALRDAGARVDFVTARDTGQTRREEREGIAVVRGGGPFTFYAHAAWWMLRHRRSLDVVVDPECGIPSFSPLWVRRSTQVVLVVHHVHQQQFATYFPRPLAVLGQWLERVAMRRVYRGRPAVAVSESTAAEMRDQLGWTGHLDIVENGSAAPGEVSADDKEAERLVVLGRLVPHKRVDLVVRTVAELAPSRPGLTLDVVGRGPELERLQALAVELGVADRVTFHGFVDEHTKHDLLRRAALHVCASDVEGWGQVVIEAAGWGIPTVARDVPGLRDSVRDGDTGLLVPDDADLAVVGERITAAVRTTLDELAVPENLTLAVKNSTAWAAGFSWARMHAEALTLLDHPTPAASAAPGATAPSTER